VLQTAKTADVNRLCWFLAQVLVNLFIHTTSNWCNSPCGHTVTRACFSPDETQRLLIQSNTLRHWANGLNSRITSPLTTSAHHLVEEYWHPMCGGSQSLLIFSAMAMKFSYWLPANAGKTLNLQQKFLCTRGFEPASCLLGSRFSQKMFHEIN